LDIRVGQFKSVWPHEKSDKLYCTKIDVGEEETRDIAAGLQQFYAGTELEGTLCLVCCNLKAKKLVGFKSHGMVLCAIDGDKVEVVEPRNAKVGDQVVLSGHEDSDVPASASPASPNRMLKKKIFEVLSQDLKVNADGDAEYMGKLLTTKSPGAKCSTNSITNSEIR
jgi:tRNA-binding EMAP/Myf-like protein